MEPVRGRRLRWRDRVRWHDKVKDDLERKCVAEQDASDRNSWRVGEVSSRQAAPIAKG